MIGFKPRSAALGTSGLIALWLIAGLFGSVAHAGEVEAHVLDDKGSPVADAVLSLHPAGRSFAPVKDVSAVMDQHGLTFVPQVLVVQAGSDVNFPNGDNVRHHVYSFSPSKTFELRLYGGEHEAAERFDRPGVVTLGCNIHDWMLGYIVVVDTPYFGKSGSDGRVRLDQVPPGDYELQLWHPRLPGAQESISENLRVNDAPVLRDYRIKLREAERSNEPPAGLEIGLHDRAQAEHEN